MSCGACSSCCAACCDCFSAGYERGAAELTEWQEKCADRSRELETAREEARRAEQARDEMQRELLEAQRDLADMRDAVAAAFGGHA